MNHFNREMPFSPETSELNAAECCALRDAFIKNPEAVSQLEGLMSKKELQFLANELKGTEHLVFIPDPETKMVYFQLAQAELKRLDHNTEQIHCGHSMEDHKRALHSVESMFSEPIN